MILLSGPPGSGKTRRVLAHFRESSDTLILAPTATLAQHLRHEMAREGLAFRPDRILTLSKFARQFTEGQEEVSNELFQLIVGAALRRLYRPEFTRVADAKGFAAAMARTMLEFDAAGVSARHLLRALDRCGSNEELPPAFAAVWREVERDIERRGLNTRGGLLQNAAAKIAFTGIGGFTRVCLDGFAALPAPELALIAALAGCAEVIVTLPEAPNSPSITAARERLLAMGAMEQVLPWPQREPTGCVRFMGESVEREADEIARRILQWSAQGVPFRRMGVVMRNREAYQPLLETTCERFGIPARAYSGTPLMDHPPARFVEAAANALLSGWDHQQTIAALRLGGLPSGVLDDLEFRARAQYPAHGLKELRGLLRGPLRMLDRFGEFDKLATAQLTARKWASQLGRLHGFREVGLVPDHLDAKGRTAYLGQARVFDTLEAALQEAAAAFEPKQQLTLAEFWAVAHEALEAAAVRPRDNRREAVHLLSAQEARQWNLDVVFLCGLVEKQFPRKHSQNPLFRDAALLALRGQGIAVRTSEELTQEEDFLFAAAIGAASREVVMSYPRLDGRGQENTPSRFFSHMQAEIEACPVVCPEPSPAARVQPPLTLLQDPALLAQALQRRKHFSASSLEIFLKCPLQYFFHKTLHLRPLPPLPEDRFDFLAQGSIAHAVLARWAPTRLPIGQLLEEEFDRFCREQHIPRSYALEAGRLRMQRLLTPFTGSYPWPDPLNLRTETPFEMALDAETLIRGTIDLIVSDAAGDRIYDYKFSPSKRVIEKLDSPTTLQAPIYLRGYEAQAGTPVRGVFFVGIKEGDRFKVTGWGDGEPPSPYIQPLTQDWVEQKLSEVRQAIANIRDGRIGANPVDAETCGFCDFQEACRHALAAAAVAGGEL